MPNIGDKILGRYQIKRELGSGNFATVYLAYDEKLKRDVAIKVISAAKSPDPGAALNTLLREAHIIAALQHPNILKIFDYQIDCEEGYLIMEYAEGGTLADILKQHSNKRLSEPKNKRSLYSFEETLRVRGNFSKKQELITLLLECPSIANRANRDLLIREVRNGAIFATFARDAVDRIDVANIVNKLLEYSGALEELISFIKLVDSGTKALQDLETFRGVLLVDSLPSDSLTLEEATSYFSDIVKGVNHAHANNVIHFDLKPENIMFVQGRPVIGDFGVAKVISSTGTIALTKLPGTPYYTAPESWDNKGNKSSDVYSLGIILYQMLAGEPPFEGNTAQLCKKHLYDPLPNLISKRPDLPIGFQSFLEFLTAKDPHARPSADKILELLEEALLTLSLPKASTNSNIPKSNTASVASQVQANTPQTTAPPQKPPSPTPTKAPATPPSQPPAAPPKPKGQIGGKLKPFGFVSVAVILIILGLLTLQPFGKGNPASSEGQTTATATGVVPTPTKAALITFPANTTVPPTLAPTITPAPPTLAPTITPAPPTLAPTETPIPLYSNTATLTGHSDAVRSVAYSPDGKTLASGSWDKSIKLWEVSTGKLLNTLTGHSYVVLSVAFSPDGKTLASGSNDNSIKLWEVSTGKLLNTLNGHSSSVWSVAYSPDGKTLASGSSDYSIKLWEVSTGKLLNTLTGHSNSVSSVAFSPDGKTLASGDFKIFPSGSNDNSIKLWDVSIGKLLNTLTEHSDSVWSVAFSPDGKTIASGSYDKSIKVWEVSTGKLLNTLTGHSSDVLSVAYSPDGKTLASGSLDNSIKLWEVSTGKLLNTLTGHSDVVRSVAYSPDGKTLASGSDDRSIKVWRVDD